jgi:hypothetical protein
MFTCALVVPLGSCGLHQPKGVQPRRHLRYGQRAALPPPPPPPPPFISTSVSYHKPALLQMRHVACEKGADSCTLQ